MSFNGRNNNKISNRPSGGGTKLQGLTPKSTHYFKAPYTGQQYSISSGDGKNRNMVFCMNQLGGVGRGKSQFSSNADGVNCGSASYKYNITYSQNELGLFISGSDWPPRMELVAIIRFLNNSDNAYNNPRSVKLNGEFTFFIPNHEIYRNIELTNIAHSPYLDIINTYTVIITNNSTDRIHYNTSSREIPIEDYIYSINRYIYKEKPITLLPCRYIMTNGTCLNHNMRFILSNVTDISNIFYLYLEQGSLTTNTVDYTTTTQFFDVSCENIVYNEETNTTRWYYLTINDTKIQDIKNLLTSNGSLIGNIYTSMLPDQKEALIEYHNSVSNYTIEIPYMGTISAHLKPMSTTSYIINIYGVGFKRSTYGIIKMLHDTNHNYGLDIITQDISNSVNIDNQGFLNTYIILNSTNAHIANIKLLMTASYLIGLQFKIDSNLLYSDSPDEDTLMWCKLIY